MPGFNEIGDVVIGSKPIGEQKPVDHVQLQTDLDLAIFIVDAQQHNHQYPEFELGQHDSIWLSTFTIVIINDHHAFFVLTWSKFSSQSADPNTVSANQCTKLS